jgi:hypothetical protein
MGATAAVQNGFSVSKAYDVFFGAGQDVKVGDRLLRNEASYLVRGIREYETHLNGHVQALCEREAT